jgi:signal transduction histidine kinase
MGLLRDESSERRRLQATIDREKLLAAELLAAGMAHEINNPLATVTTNLEWLAATLPALVVKEAHEQTPGPSSIGPVSAALVDALAGAERIEATVRFLSMLSGLQDPHRELLDVRLVLESALTELEGQLERDIAIVRNYSDVAAVLASEQRLKQAFVNLLVNAAQSIGKDSTSRCITLSTLGQSRVRVEIADSGSGVAEVVRDRLFTPFVTTKALGVGKGLSLFVCKTIVESAGGEVGFRTTPGRGSTFWLELPAALPGSPP